MIAVLWLGLAILTLPFKSRCRLEAENVALRHQLMLLRRQARGRVKAGHQRHIWFSTSHHLADHNVLRPPRKTQAAVLAAHRHDLYRA